MLYPIPRTTDNYQRTFPEVIEKLLLIELIPQSSKIAEDAPALPLAGSPFHYVKLSKGDAVACYCELLATQEMGYHRLNRAKVEDAPAPRRPRVTP